MREHQTDGKADDGCRGDQSFVPFQKNSNSGRRNGAGCQNFLHIGRSVQQFCQRRNHVLVDLFGWACWWKKVRDQVG
jgi:hypothetical protein